MTNIFKKLIVRVSMFMFYAISVLSSQNPHYPHYISGKMNDLSRITQADSVEVLTGTWDRPEQETRVLLYPAPCLLP